MTSVLGRCQFSAENAYRVRYSTFNSPQPSTHSRTACAPASWPLMRGSPRDLAHRPLPSMMIAMWRGTVFTLEDIRLTSGIWHQEANVWKSRMTNLEEMTNGSMAKTTRVILSGAKRNRKDLVELPEGFAAGFLDSTRNDRVDPRFS